MKKALSLILALVLCLGLCACGSNVEANESLAETTVETDPLGFLYGAWVRNDDWDFGYGIVLEENGIDYDVGGTDISWTSSNGILKISGQMFSGLFKYLNNNGFDYLVSEEYTFVRPDDLDAVPRTTAIELSVDNWKDYFEIQVNTIELKDQFGDLTGEVITETFLQVKEHNRLICEVGTDPILIRFSIGGETIDGETSIGKFQLHCSESLTIDQIEMIKIEGKITYLDGI